MKKVWFYVMTITILLIICTVLCSCKPDSIEYYMFVDISECNNIEVCKSKDAKVTTYDTPDEDNNLNGLEYDSFYSANYESDKLNFKIFAYEFVDSNSAKEYFKKETGIETDLDTHFLASGGLMEYSVIVIDENRAYCAYTTQKDSENLEMFLGNIFSKKLEL